MRLRAEGGGREGTVSKCHEHADVHPRKILLTLRKIPDLYAQTGKLMFFRQIFLLLA